MNVVCRDDRHPELSCQLRNLWIYSRFGIDPVVLDFRIEISFPEDTDETSEFLFCPFLDDDLVFDPGSHLFYFGKIPVSFFDNADKFFLFFVHCSDASFYSLELFLQIRK